MYEYQVNGETRRKFSVAHVVRPRTQASNACLCFTLMSQLPEQKPWKRSVSARDPSQGVLLDLQEDCEWRMPSTVIPVNIDPVTVFDDNMQVQCGQCVFGADQPKWTYRKVPKVEEELRALMEHGMFPLESSAKDRFCVMCPVKRGSPRLLPCCLCYNCHVGCNYETNPGRVCNCKSRSWIRRGRSLY